MKKYAYLCTRFSIEETDGAIAQLVEQRTENPCVPGSIPGGTTQKKELLNESSAALSLFGRAERPRTVQVMAKTTAGCRLARRRSGAVSAVCSAYMREIYYLCGDMGDIMLNTLFAAYGMDWLSIWGGSPEDK